MPEMVLEKHVKSERTDVPNCHQEFDSVCEGWFKEYGSKVTENHFLRLNHVKLYWCKASTRYERTADLCLRGEVAAMPNQADKVLVKGAVKFSAEWPNA